MTMRTIDRERYEAERLAACDEAIWEAVDSLAGQVFSYMDVCWIVRARLQDLGYDDSWSSWSVSAHVEPTMREMAKAGLIQKVRAFDPPTKPHLFTLAETEATR